MEDKDGLFIYVTCSLLMNVIQVHMDYVRILKSVSNNYKKLE